MTSKEICEKFATDHKVIFKEDGECGFGRECVGFLNESGNYVDHNPLNMQTYDSIPEYKCEAVEPPDIAFYHKHDCLAVLGRGDSAVDELAEWVNKINKAGNVRIVRYATGATGMQAMLSGSHGYTVMAG